MNNDTFILRIDNARDRMKAAWDFACRILELGTAVKVTIKPVKSTRSLEQNAKMWAVLTDIAEQVPWFMDGKQQYLEPEDWKDILTAGLKKHQRIASGIEGGFVMLGCRTSKMSIPDMIELIEFALFFGAENGVRFGGERLAA